MVAEWRASGLPRAEFAAQRGLVDSTLRWWVSALGRSGPPEPAQSGFVEVVGSGTAAGIHAATAVPKRAAREPVGVAIRVGADVTIVVGSLPDPEYVARLAAAFEGCRS